MVSIGIAASSENLTEDCCATCDCKVVTLEDEDGCTFTHDEAIATLVKGHRLASG